MTEREQLEQAIATLEAQRALLGNAIAEAALAPLRQKLADLNTHAVTEQRKQVTILFADTAGFTAMAAQMDPEDVRDVMRAYFDRWTRAITSYGGVVEKFIGDAVMAVFGIPVAQETDPENAVRAALAMRQSLDELNADLERKHQVQLAMRIGINTGPVVISFMVERAAESFAAVGDTVNLASRLEHAAPINGILISHATYRHVRSLFDVQRLAPLSVKGKQEPVQVYLVQGSKPRAFRFASRGIEEITVRMIGREAELGRLQDLLSSVAKEQTPHLLTIVGAAGVGKSRLLDEFISWAEQLPDGVLFFKGRADQRMSRAPYALIRDIFAFRCDIQDSDGVAVARQKLYAGICQVMGAAGEEYVPFIGHLLGFDFSDTPHLRGLLSDARQIRDYAFDYVAQFFAATAKEQAPVIVLEDIHWADKDSLTMIEHLSQACRAVPLLIVCTARPSCVKQHPSWGEDLPHTRLDLCPLPEQESYQLVSEMLQKAPNIPPALYDLVTSRAEGNPFYLEELLKMLIEDGVIVTNSDQWQVELDRLATMHVPPTLTGVLQARLDGLSLMEREVLQRAAVVGRVFWDDAVSELSEEVVVQTLHNQSVESRGAQTTKFLGLLQNKGLVANREPSAFIHYREYMFSHALLHDVTYESLLKRQRRAYHERVATWLIMQSGERVEAYAGHIGEHFERAGNPTQAVEWYRQAARRAQSAYAPETAIAYYRRILDLLPAPTSLTQTIRQMEAYEGLGEMLLWQGRLTDAETEFSAMRAAAEGAGDEVAQARAWYGLAEVQEHRTNYRAALDNARSAEECARSADSQRDIAMALQMQGWCLFNLGAIKEALTLGEQALLVSTELDAVREMARSLNLLAAAHTRLENYQQAAYYMQSALAWYRQLGDRMRICGTLHNLGDNALACGDYQAAVTYYQDALGIAHDIKSSRRELLALGQLGGARIKLGDYDAGATDVRHAMSMANAAGGQLYRFVCYLAEACLAQGNLEAALTQSLSIVEAAHDAVAPHELGVAWRLLGSIAARFALWPDSMRHQLSTPYLQDPAACFAKSAEILSAAGLEAERARTLQAWANYADQNGDMVPGTTLWQAAREIFARLGMEIEIERMIKKPV